MLICVAITEINYSNCDVAHSHDFSRTKATFVTVTVSIVDGAPLTVLAGCRKTLKVAHVIEIQPMFVSCVCGT